MAQAVGNQWQPRPRCSTTPSPSSPELNRTFGQERPPPLLNIVIRSCSRTGGPPPPHKPPGQSQAGSCCSAEETVRTVCGQPRQDLERGCKTVEVSFAGSLTEQTCIYPKTSVLGRPKCPLPCRGPHVPDTVHGNSIPQSRVGTEAARACMMQSCWIIPEPVATALHRIDWAPGSPQLCKQGGLHI